MTDVKARIIELETRFATIKKSLNLENLRLDLKKLESQSSDPDLWKDQTHARDLMQRIGDLKKQVEQVETLEKDISGLEELSADESLASDLEKEAAGV